MPVDLLAFERPLVEAGAVVVGIDEVGRGALAGPLVVGAVAVRTVASPPAGLNDSKMLTARRREALVEGLTTWAASSALGWVTPGEIDDWGMSLALTVAASRAMEGLTVTPTHALLDGRYNFLHPPALRLSAGAVPPLRFGELPVTTLVRGDGRSATIAAASVLAKVARDAFMVARGAQYPAYEWAGNKGYGSPGHLAALRTLGPCDEHRRSWNLPVA